VPSFKRWSFGIAIACRLVAEPAAALDWGLDGRVGAIHSDNVAQAPPSLRDSSAIGTAELHGVVGHSTRTLLLDAEATHSYRHFFDDAYDAENRSQLRSAVDWMPAGEWLTLSVADTYGQLALNPAEGLLPSEYQNANVLTAGPTVALPLGLDTRLQLGGEYRRATFEDSPFDTERKFGSLSLERDLSRLLSAHVAGSIARVEFDVADLTRTYDVRSAEVGIDAIGRRSSLGLSVGVDQLDSGDTTFEGTRLQLDFERRLSTSTHVFLTAQREITDSAEIFTLGQSSDPALGSIRDVQVTPQPLLRGQYRAGWVWSGSSVDLNLHAGYIREQFQGVPLDPLVAAGLDRNVRELGLGATYRFRGGSSLGLTGEVLRERFDSGARSNDLLTTATYLQELGDRLDLELRAQRIERDQSSRDFNELRLFVFLRYTLREASDSRQAVFDRALEQRSERRRARGAEEASGTGRNADD
jgi:hypothetical protein